MTLRFFVAFPLLALALAGSVRPVRAQSLADVARKEEERRKTVKDAGKTLSNKDLPNTPASSTDANPAPVVPEAPAADAASSDGQSKAADGADTAGTAGTAGTDDKDKNGESPKDQKYWGNRMKNLQATLENDQTLADAVQTRINSLTTDFVNRDDPAQRSVIAQNKQKAIDEQAHLTQAIAADTKAIADLEEEARHAGVPAGWLR